MKKVAIAVAVTTSFAAGFLVAHVDRKVAHDIATTQEGATNYNELGPFAGFMAEVDEVLARNNIPIPPPLNTPATTQKTATEIYCEIMGADRCRQMKREREELKRE